MGIAIGQDLGHQDMGGGQILGGSPSFAQAAVGHLWRWPVVGPPTYDLPLFMQCPCKHMPNTLL